MRAWYTGADFAAAAIQQHNELTHALRQSEELTRRHQARRADVAARYQHAEGELLRALLPALTPEAIQRAVALTGYTPLAQHDLLGEARTEEARLRERIAAIEAEPRFIHREFLRAPRVGKLTREVDELLEHRAPLAQVLAACAHPAMEALCAVGYGTPDYAVPFWRMSYYAHWEAGDQIMERWPGKTFAEVRAEYLRARDTVHTFDGRIRELRAEIAQGEAVELEHRRATEALATIPERHLGRARHWLGRHVVDCGIRVLGPRLAAEPDVELIAKRVSGLGHKLAYLDRLGETHLGRAAGEIRTTLQKTSRDIAKYQRPKYFHAQFPAQAYQHRFRPRGQRHVKGWQRYQQASDSVYAFDRYDQGRLLQDFLWWDLMTDGRLDGDFIPEVVEHRRRYPDHRYTRSHDHDDDLHHARAGAALAGHHPQDDGPFDPS